MSRRAARVVSASVNLARSVPTGWKPKGRRQLAKTWHCPPAHHGPLLIHVVKPFAADKPPSRLAKAWAQHALVAAVITEAHNPR